jgi:hypothetical protein
LAEELFVQSMLNGTVVVAGDKQGEKPAAIRMGKMTPAA